MKNLDVEKRFEDDVARLATTISQYEDAMKWAPHIHRLQGFVAGMIVATLLWYFLP
ncbi:hypothetical protein QTA58_00150 [Neorhizobium sp. CSC1952]|uniref:hypothetical protein n=1 Tax=Neorhizobium sp. CSC1952 TaxID=2978974 RepID=UPI0025A6451C|nr:hypothetical protein [Rhizobium sp. CSC1952]WJR67191.1 hypothetical protein QTA58_23930 [Rhizobium sp. CSC1952]WJR67220.1 hypothetical protein QTA58_00150 [Rhizobium sp. CSC1952]